MLQVREQVNRFQSIQFIMQNIQTNFTRSILFASQAYTLALLDQYSPHQNGSWKLVPSKRCVRLVEAEPPSHSTVVSIYSFVWHRNQYPACRLHVTSCLTFTLEIKCKKTSSLNNLLIANSWCAWLVTHLYSELNICLTICSKSLL